MAEFKTVGRCVIYFQVNSLNANTFSLFSLSSVNTE